jgi:hypothetical protein
MSAVSSADGEDRKLRVRAYLATVATAHEHECDAPNCEVGCMVNALISITEVLHDMEKGELRGMKVKPGDMWSLLALHLGVEAEEVS